MKEIKFLQHGLDALSRAHRTNYFTDGHRGAAMIAAYFLCNEIDVEPGVSDVLAALMDKQWFNAPLCEPFPREPYDDAGIKRILTTLEKNLDGLRQAGHNVIFPTLALKAFSHLPELLTPSRISGICKLIEAFSTVAPMTLEQHEMTIEFDSEPAIAEFILSELQRTIHTFTGRGQGWSGHLLTYARALLDLRQLGYIETSKRAESGFSLYLKRIRTGPLDTDKPRREHPPSELYPHQLAYWVQREDKPLNLGHSIKYPYGFYGWINLVNNQSLIDQCYENAYHIF